MHKVNWCYVSLVFDSEEASQFPFSELKISGLSEPSQPESHGVTVVVVDMSTATLLSSGKDEESEKKDEMDDDTMFTTLGEEDKSKPFVAPRWATRVFAADCLCRIINLCEIADQAHFDLAMARSAKLRNPKSKHKITSFPQSILICVRFPLCGIL